MSNLAISSVTLTNLTWITRQLRLGSASSLTITSCGPETDWPERNSSVSDSRRVASSETVYFLIANLCWSYELPARNCRPTEFQKMRGVGTATLVVINFSTSAPHTEEQAGSTLGTSCVQLAPRCINNSKSLNASGSFSSSEPPTVTMAPVSRFHSSIHKLRVPHCIPRT